MELLGPDHLGTLESVPRSPCSFQLDSGDEKKLVFNQGPLAPPRPPTTQGLQGR
jgi:hypothetical protein